MKESRVKDDSTSSTWKDGAAPPLRWERPWEEQAWREIGLGLGSAEFDALSSICMENWELVVVQRSGQEMRILGSEITSSPEVWEVRGEASESEQNRERECTGSSEESVSRSGIHFAK